ncbi:MAG: YhcH/YjgK/YiaL family protein [Thermodesulfobacteriota bacterium]
MIIDCLENWKTYRYGDAWKCAFEFLMSLTHDAEERNYHLQGDNVFAQVMSYETRRPEAAVLEAHRNYIDIQTVLIGGEGFEWFPSNSLTVEKPYDTSKDAAFYHRPASGPARLTIFPGTFVTFFPQDAHMPSLMTGNSPELIKKVVVKLHMETLLSHG